MPTCLGALCVFAWFGLVVMVCSVRLGAMSERGIA